MFTDMVGFSALSQRNEALALELLGEQRTLVRRFLAPHAGHEVKTMGDGFLIEFPSALEAVNAAVDIQSTLHARNGRETADRRIQLRIGIHTADIVSSEGDIHGDGVNIAARIEPLASPGGICVSEDVERQVRNKLPHAVTALGPFDLKNISLPVVVHRVVLPWEPTPSRGLSSGAGKRIAWSWIALVGTGLFVIGGALFFSRPNVTKPATRPSAAIPSIDQKAVAVLAFANTSDDKGNEYFSDGISEELLNVLSKVPGLKVSARTSAFYFKGKQVPLAEIARQLGVAYVVEGSVRKAGNRVRISAQLINAADGFQVWSDNFDRDAKDVFAVQDEIAALIAKNLQVSINAQSSPLRPVNPQALELYLQGRQAWNLRTSESLTRAENLFQRALDLDPSFARACTGVADARMLRESIYGDLDKFGNRNSPALKELIAQVEQALALDPDSAEAHASLGNAYFFGWRFAEAESALRKAIALNPNYASAHHWLGRVLWSDGRIDESSRELARAAELDPLSPRILDNYAIMLHVQGRYAEALTFFDRALALQPDSRQAGVWRAVNLVALGRTDEAMAQIHSMPQDWGYHTSRVVQALVGAGHREEAEHLMRNYPVAGTGDEWEGWAALGDREETFARLSANQMQAAVVGLVYLNGDLDPFRNDPRIVQLLATTGRTEANARAQAWRASRAVKTAK